MKINNIINKINSDWSNKLKTSKGTWNHSVLKQKKHDIIQIILENKQWFFIPYNFHDKTAKLKDKFMQRSVEEHDLQKLDISTLIRFLNELQQKHSRMIGVSIAKYEVQTK